MLRPNGDNNSHQTSLRGLREWSRILSCNLTTSRLVSPRLDLPLIIAFISYVSSLVKVGKLKGA